MEFESIINNIVLEKEYAKANYVPIIRKKSAKFLYEFLKENKIKIV